MKTIIREWKIFMKWGFGYFYLVKSIFHNAVKDAVATSSLLPPEKDVLKQESYLGYY